MFFPGTKSSAKWPFFPVSEVLECFETKISSTKSTFYFYFSTRAQWIRIKKTHKFIFFLLRVIYL